MKGVILAGGTGSRLRPLTKVTNKHLLPVGRKPMIFHPIEKLVAAGITKILIVTGVEHMGDIVTLLGSGKDFNCKFTYKVQDEAGGIAQALALAEEFCGDDPLCVVLGDNVFQDEISAFADSFLKQKSGAMILLKEVSDPHRFGVAEFKGKKIVSIEEKPKKPKSNFAVTGIYFYDNRVFEIVKKLKPSGRGELEISDVNRVYLSKGTLSYDLLSGFWSDAGTFESLERAGLMVEGKVRI
ncbi:spore coat protein [candidate division WOR-1 bacterium RIFOXYA12_FULL_43_27]|uniref:Glucose-1-phosphate thymidylyltransferase n=1 Tax=candidate division WOR-1 bacterium RIFOXYC2_FULL_46_14 TaxID=1802587 RepID=A0A1F4U5R2_UNCSA|nr:MAG: spore coat protein [candidate division WOR-1 bacterium RIFOXYA12_FULL_43_27]OGC20916.1 MAG: spore coat protein [candidate division WOR-1 bacterium RIFOXYB2_FULL_46_45]OGC32324.1 MAG: spore coat protein [candidate division WOR-1 bacterium RIFOXYA2_FULL_46_56]OGC39623.1 MAG: spore coat protein [candidate division WOR-1 bacterium RIFOXYC2_FULL_46_14]